MLLCAQRTNYTTAKPAKDLGAPKDHWLLDQNGFLGRMNGLNQQKHVLLVGTILLDVCIFSGQRNYVGLCFVKSP